MEQNARRALVGVVASVAWVVSTINENARLKNDDWKAKDWKVKDWKAKDWKAPRR